MRSSSSTCSPCAAVARIARDDDLDQAAQGRPLGHRLGYEDLYRMTVARDGQQLPAPDARRPLREVGVTIAELGLASAAVAPSSRCWLAQPHIAAQAADDVDRGFYSRADQ